MAMAIPGLDFPVRTMNEQFGPLVLCDFSSALDSIRLSVENFGCFLGTRTTNGPAVFVGHYMLVALGSHLTSFHSGTIAA